MIAQYKCMCARFNCIVCECMTRIHTAHNRMTMTQIQQLWHWISSPFNSMNFEIKLLIFSFFLRYYRWTLLLTKSVPWWTKSETFVICPSSLTSITANQLWPIRWCQRLVSLPVQKLVKPVSPTPAKMNKNVALPSNRRKLRVLHAFTFAIPFSRIKKIWKQHNLNKQTEIWNCLYEWSFYTFSLRFSSSNEF